MQLLLGHLLRMWTELLLRSRSQQVLLRRRNHLRQRRLLRRRRLQLRKKAAESSSSSSTKCGQKPERLAQHRRSLDGPVVYLLKLM